MPAECVRRTDLVARLGATVAIVHVARIRAVGSAQLASRLVELSGRAYELAAIRW